MLNREVGIETRYSIWGVAGASKRKSKESSESYYWRRTLYLENQLGLLYLPCNYFKIDRHNLTFVSWLNLRSQLVDSCCQLTITLLSRQRSQRWEPHNELHRLENARQSPDCQHQYLL